MKENVIFQSEQSDKKTQVSPGLDPYVILILLKKYWYLLAIGLFLGILGSKIYIRHTMPVYNTTVTIQINTNDGAGSKNNELLQGFGLPVGSSNIENQMWALKSRELTERTLQQLPFEVEWYFRTIRNMLPIYPRVPFKIHYDNELPLPRDIEFSLTLTDSNRFTLSCEDDYFPINKTASFGDTIEFNKNFLIIDCVDPNWLASNKEGEVFFIIYSRARLVNNFSNRVNVEMLTKGGSILQVGMRGTNPQKDADFLNTHLEEFQNTSLARKNMEADRRIEFIDNQLNWISDTLSTTENRLQQFRSTNRVMDVSAQGGVILGQLTTLENQKAGLELEANYYDYLADYLAKESSSEIPIIPITMGINDPGLTNLVNELSQLQNQYSSRAAGEMNPLQRNMEQRIRATKEALHETLNGLRRKNSLARSDNQEQINRANARASALPITERQLIGIERKFKLNDELYTFLLEARAEQQMQKAANRADSEIIDKADPRFSTLVSPDSTKIQFIGLLAGLGIPLLLIFFSFIFNTKIKEEDLKRLTDWPLVGNIPHIEGVANNIVFRNPNSSAAEAFRLLRSRMQFLTKEAETPVILVTSSLPDDGKTLISINLSAVYSLLGKRTILLGFDLRKPKIFQDFGLSNETGISTWLIGKEKLGDIIQETEFSNLSIISSGPIPPNPSELTALAKTGELINLLKENYDYIIIDSSPIGVVSDTFHLASLADACLLVVRPDKTIRDSFVGTIHEINQSGLNAFSIVINDTKSKGKNYGYGGKYGYTDDNKKLKLRFQRKNKKKQSE